MFRKPLLLASSILLSSVSALAIDTPPSLTIGGYARFQSYGFQNSRTPTYGPDVTAAQSVASVPVTGRGRGYAFAQTGEIAFKVLGKLDNGLTYGYTLAIDGDSGQNVSGFKPTVNENHLLFSDNWGVVELGDTDGVQDYFTVGPMNVLGATGGIGGDYRKVFTTSAEVFTSTLMIGDSQYSTKLSYYTPRIAGLKLGVSFTPSSNEQGSRITDSSSSGQMRTTKNIAVGINYAKAWNTFGLNLSLAGIAARTKRGTDSYTATVGSKIKDVRAWSAGALLTYDRWMFGLGYIDNGTSMVPESYARLGADAGKSYSTALGYNFGSSKVALGYQKTVTNIKAGTSKGKADVFSLTGDYTIAPGLGIYAEADYANLKTNQTAVARNIITNGTKNKGNNKGGIFIAGVKISF